MATMSVSNTSLEVVLLLVSVAVYLLIVYLFVRIFKKAGLGWWGLLSVVPFMITPLLIVLGFAEWPATKKK